MASLHLTSYLILWLSFTSIQAQTKKEQTDKCITSRGWYYLSSASASGAGGGGGGGSFSASGSWSSASAACVQANVPDDCIRANPLCAWCTQSDFAGNRCNLEETLIAQDCSSIEMVRSKFTSIASSGVASRMSHSYAQAQIRVGDSVTIPFQITEPEIYPVDFYYLMDVSYSMNDDLHSVTKLGSVLVQTLRELTRGGNGSVQIGFGKFVDKVQSPMTQMTPYKLKHPYDTWTDPPFLFKNVIELTPDVDRFQEVLGKEKVSGNLDPPEGALGAMLQVMECKKLIGWRGNALRLLLIATESAFHYAGDGSSFLAGISKSNDGSCHTESDGNYVGAEQQDYPTINQVVRSSEANSITPIFAVGNTYADMYKSISKDFFRGSTYGILSSDSSNVVELVRKAYLDISGQQELITTNPDNDIICPWYTAVAGGGSVRSFSADNVYVGGLSSGSMVSYNLSMAANAHSCVGQGTCNLGNLVVKQLRYDDSLTVDTTVIGGFPCASRGDINSTACSLQGDFVCGICLCHSGWAGPICNILDVGAIGCMAPDMTICSGRGICVNDRCQCDHGHKHNKDKIFGDFCECDECPKRAGLVCANNGLPVVEPGKCGCKCDCNDGWQGADCGCATTTATCVGVDGIMCSGRGTCVCGACVCEPASGYGGPTCSTCLENCPTCGKFQSCIQCRMYSTGPKNETCLAECKDYEIAVTDAYEIKDEDYDENSGTFICVGLDATDNCKFYYTYKELETGVYRFIAEKEKRCKPAYSLIVVLWCFLLFLLIGLILLCCWRCCVYVIDKEEERNYTLGKLAKATMPAFVPLLPVMTAGSIIEFIKAKYLVRRSAKVAVIPIRRSFVNGESSVNWKTYAGSSEDDDFEVLSEGESGTLARKQHKEKVQRMQSGDMTIEMEPMSGAVGGNGTAGSRYNRSTLETVNETAPLLTENGNYITGYDWGSGTIHFKDEEEFANIEIPLTHDFSGSEIMFWVELYGQEKGVALGLKRTKVIVIRDEDAGTLGFPKPSYVFKENDQNAVVPIHRTIGMDGHISVTWFTRDITAISGQHYKGGRGVVEFADGEVTHTVEIPLVPDILYDDSEKAFNIELENPKGGATLDLAHCMITVLCDEECSLVQFPKEAYPFLENCGMAEINVIRTHSTKGVSVVHWKTEDDTAIAGKDYEASQGTITFANAITDARIRIPIIDNDVYDEHGRQFKVTMYDPSEGTKLSQPQAVVTIIEDDEPGQFEFTKQSIVLRNDTPGELHGKLSIIRSLGCDGHVAIPWFVQNHDNKPIPHEIASLSGSVDFQNQEVTQYLDLDLTKIPDGEMYMFEVILLQPTNSGKLGMRNKATVTIFGEADVGSVGFAQSHFQSLASVGMATILVSRKGNMDSAAFVVCETSDKTAINGTHYRGGTSSIVFKANEAAQEVGIPIYNDPNYQGDLIFGVTLKSTPGGPKIIEPSYATVSIACMPMSPVYHAGFAAPGPCTIEFIKSKYLTRKSVNVLNIPVHRSSQDGACSVDWSVSSISGANFRRIRRSSSSSSSSEEYSQQQRYHEENMPHGRVYFDNNEERSSIDINIEEMDIDGQQMYMKLQLDSAFWADDRDDDIRLGLRESEVVVLNDIDAGTLGFPKPAFSFSENSKVVSIPIQRLGGTDGAVALKWCTRDDSAISGRDYEGGSGIIKFANNQNQSEIQIPFITGKDYIDVMTERSFTIELSRPTGGAKLGNAKAVVRIVGDQERSIVQFGKTAYPVIGSSTMVQIPVLRTGDYQRKVSVQWFTKDGTARQGIDYKLMRDTLTFEPDVTRGNIEIPLSGQTTEPKNFSVHLQIPQDKAESRNVTLGENNVATISIISSQEPGMFEFNKPSFLFRANTGAGLVPVIRSNGSDGKITIPWKIESMDKPSPFAGAEGFLSFEEGQISASVEIGLHGVPSDAFVLILLPPSGGAKLGKSTRATVTILGAQEEPIVEMESPEMSLKTNEVVLVHVIREGNLEEPTYVGWKTDDETAVNGQHYIGGAGNLVMEPGEKTKEISLPVISPPTDGEATFIVRLTEVRGLGKVGGTAQTRVTLEAMPKPQVEFTRQRHHFRQSQGSALVPVIRSITDGTLTIRWHTRNLSNKAVKQQLEGSYQSGYASSSDDEAQEIIPEDEFMDWGSGTITFEDGEMEAAIEIVLYRDLAQKEAHFKIELDDPWEKVNFGMKETLVTVMKDKDAGQIGFGSDRFDFSCNDKELVIPIHRSSGADGTVSVPWFTRDGTAIGGMHYLPDDGNIVFRDGEVLRKITIPMPRRPAIFEEDQVAFQVALGEPTGGAKLKNQSAAVVLKNDVVPGVIAFMDPAVICRQSDGVASAKLIRTEGTAGKVVVPWRVTSAPGKPKSRYEGIHDEVVFQDNEDTQDVEVKLPKTLLPTDNDYFVIELDSPKAGRAELSPVDKCQVTVDNNITSGVFSLGEPTYSFNQSNGRGTVTVMRSNGTEGEVSLPWKIKSITPGVVPSVLHNTRGVAEFNPGQTEAKIDIPLPKDSENDEESFMLALSPPGGRGKLGDPNHAEIHLNNDVPCLVGFTQPLHETRGDIDNLLVPVIREGPKGRSVNVRYKTKDGTAKDLQHFIGEEGVLSFAPGEDKKDILIPILNDPSGERVTFEVELFNIEGAGKFGQYDQAIVAIDNLAGPGVFIMACPEINVDQSKGSVVITVLRTRGRKGKVEIPWFIETKPDGAATTRRPSSYDQLEGTLAFDDGEGQKDILVPLENSPQDDDNTAFEVVMLTPITAGGATLGEPSCVTVNVNNDVDGGTVEMATDKVEVFGTDKEVLIPVVRSGSNEHKCYITWEAEDVSAIRGKHYKGQRGNLSFEPGEQSKQIMIPIMNDPSGDVMFFNVKLGQTKGGAKLGNKKATQVLIDHVKEERRILHVIQQQQAKYIEHGEIYFENPKTVVKQSDGKFRITLNRKTGSVGRVIVPWQVTDIDPITPYNGLKGQETFKDGETESHIDIDVPPNPQVNDEETFSVQLGQPSGGAFLVDETNCHVTVVNDIMHGRISFPEDKIETKQSKEVAEIPITRSKRTEGRVRVPWATEAANPNSAYNGLSGIETFEDGDKVSTIQIPLSQAPNDAKTEEFTVLLGQPKTTDAVLGEQSECIVEVDNDIAPALITFESPSQEALQSTGRAHVPIKRSQRMVGRVIVPWKVIPQDPESPYVDLVGETIIEDGDENGNVEVHLPKMALPESEDVLTLILEDPIGGKLGDEAISVLKIENDVGEGVIEMKNRNVTCSSDDDGCTVTVARKLGQDFPAVVRWEAEDEDAKAGVHYDADKGQLKFKPGEVERPIHIPLMNDPTGKTRHFNVKVTGVDGRDKIGEITECKVRITNEATPPNMVKDFKADLSGPQEIHATWSPPVGGAPVEGYKVSYWGKPGDVKTVEVPPEVTETILSPLEPSVSYQVAVKPYNDVGDGAVSNTVIVDTQPELRLSYDTPQQFKTSEKTADLNLTRNLTTFKTCVECRLIKEIRRKPARPTSTDGSSSSSSSSEDETDSSSSPEVLVTSELYFEPGQSKVTVELPLDQEMRKTSQVFYLRVYPIGAADDEKPLANIELHIVNDTGIPGKVRKPFVASSKPHECTVSWEEPVQGGPVEGYKIVAKSDENPDVVQKVPADTTKVQLKNLEPSTEYFVTVQPFNKVGEASPSRPAQVTTQDELKVNFAEKHYSFKMSDKVAVIPIKRHFTHGYVTLHWKTQWSKTDDDSSSSSSSDSDIEPKTADSWASGAVSFTDGQDTADVQVPLKSASQPRQKKTSYFYLYIMDPNKRKKIASQKCELIDDKAYGVIGFPEPIMTVLGEASAPSTFLIPVVRTNGTDGDIIVNWKVDTKSDGSDFVLDDSLEGSIAFSETENTTTIVFTLITDWVDELVDCDHSDVLITLTSAEKGAILDKDPEKRSCKLRLIPAERGCLSVEVDNKSLQWPPPEDKIILNLNRKNGTYGRSYVQWAIKSPEEDSDSESDVLDDWFSKKEGEVQIPSGDDSAIIEIPVHTKHEGHRVVPPTSPLEFVFDIDAITPGVVLPDTEKSKKFALLPPVNRPGEVTLEQPQVTVNKVDKVVKVKVLRTHGTDGYIEVDYVTIDGTAKTGKHFEGAQMDTIKFYDGESEKYIVIPKTSEIFKDEKSFKIELKEVRNGGEMGKYLITEIKLMPTSTEPPGKISFPKSFETDKKLSSNKSDKVVIPIERSGGKKGNVKVAVKTKDHTAKHGKHYVKVDEIVTLKDGESKTEIEIPLIKCRHKNKLDFNVHLSEPANGATLGKTSSINIKLYPTITEPPGEVSLDTVTPVIIADQNKSDIVVIPISRKNGNGGDIKISCETKDLSAIDGVHYKGLEKTSFEMKDLENEIMIKIPLLPEKYRSDKEFVLKISNPQGGAKLKGPKEKKIILKSNDTEPCGEIELPTSIKLNAVDNDTAKLILKRINGTGGTLCVDYHTKDGTGIAGEHYEQVSGTVKLRPGETEAMIEVPVIKTIYNNDLNFKICLSSTRGAEDTINNNLECDVELLCTYVEPPGTLIFSEETETSISANSADHAIIKIDRIDGHGGDVKVHVKTKEGSAKNGQHYLDLDDIITFSNGETKAEVKVLLIKSRYKDNVDFKVTLLEPQNGVKLGKQCTKKITLKGTITEPPGELTLPTDSYEIIVDPQSQDVLTIPIMRSHGNGGDIAVHCETKDLNAKSGIHYEGVSEDCIIPDQDDKYLVTIQLIPSKFRKNLDFMVKLSDPKKGAVIKGAKEKRIILQATDREPCGELELPSLIETCAKDENKVLKIPVKRVNGSGGTLCIQCITKDETARAGKHYENINKTLFLEPGQKYGEIEIPIISCKYNKDLSFKLLIDKSDEGETINNPSEHTVVLQKTYSEPQGKVALVGMNYDVYADVQKALTVKIPVVRVGGSGGDIEVDYQTVNNSAISGTHFTETHGTLVFKDGETRKMIDIDLIPCKYRKNLKFNLELSGCKGGGEIERSQVCIFLNRTDERQQGEVKLPPNNAVEISANKRNSVFIPIKRVGGTGGDVDIHFKTEDRTAKAGTHYITCTGVAKIKDGEDTGSIEIPILKENYRNSLHFAVHLHHTKDDDSKIQNELQVNLLPTYVQHPGILGFDNNEEYNYSPLEVSAAKIPLRRRGGKDGEISCKFGINNKTAIPGEHFIETSGIITIPDQKDVVYINVPLIKSAVFSRAVKFEIEITPVSPTEHLQTGNLKQIITIMPTKKEPIGFLGFPKEHYKFSVLDNPVVKIPVKRTEGTGGLVTVDYFTRDNTAISGTHYNETVGTLVFEDGEDEKEIEILTAQHAEYDQPLSFGVELGATNMGIDVVDLYETEVTLTPTFKTSSSSSLSSSSSSSDEGDPGVLGFTASKYEFSAIELAQESSDKIPRVLIGVQRTESTKGKVAIDYYTRDNSAVAGVHYEETQGKLVFRDGESDKDIKVVVNENAKYTEPVSFVTELGATTRDADVNIYETEIVLKPTSDLLVDSPLSDDQVRIKRTHEYVDQQTDIKTVIVQQVTETEETGDAGELGFPNDIYECDVTNKDKVSIPIERTYGQFGKVNVEWFTRENTAIAGKDFVESSGVAEFDHGQAMQYIHVPILPQKFDKNRDHTFIVELGQADNDATIGRYEATVMLYSSSDDKARLSAPKEVHTQAPTPQSIEVSWEPCNNAQEYWVSYKRAGAREEPSRKTANPEDGGLLIEELEPESTYALVVTAIGEGGAQASSDVISCATPGRVPGPPNRLAFQVLSPTSLQCSWGEPAETNGPIISYDVLYLPTPDDGETAPIMVRIPDGHYRSLLVEDLIENQPYNYKVRALNKWGPGEFREADMKIENMGSRPPSAIFLNTVEGTFIQPQDQQNVQMTHRRGQNRKPQQEDVRDGQQTSVLQHYHETPGSTNTEETSQTKTRVTRYIHKDGIAEPEVETTEYDGRLSQDELAKLAEDAGRIEGSNRSSDLQVQVITYNTSRTQSTPGQRTIQLDATSPQHKTYAQHEMRSPFETESSYSDRDVKTEISTDVQEFTDVEESKDGDTEVTTITKTFKTTTTEKRLETEKGMKQYMVQPGSSSKS